MRAPARHRRAGPFYVACIVLPGGLNRLRNRLRTSLTVPSATACKQARRHIPAATRSRWRASDIALGWSHAVILATELPHDVSEAAATSGPAAASPRPGPEQGATAVFAALTDGFGGEGKGESSAQGPPPKRPRAGASDAAAAAVVAASLKTQQAPLTFSRVRGFPPPGLTVTCVSAGERHAAAVSSDGRCWAWGDDTNGCGRHWLSAASVTACVLLISERPAVALLMCFSGAQAARAAEGARGGHHRRATVAGLAGNSQS